MLLLELWKHVISTFLENHPSVQIGCYDDEIKESTALRQL